MWKDARRAVASARGAAGRLFPPIVPYIKTLPIPLGLFRFGSVNGVDTKKCRSARCRQVKPNTKRLMMQIGTTWKQLTKQAVV